MSLKDIADSKSEYLNHNKNKEKILKESYIFKIKELLSTILFHNSIYPCSFAKEHRYILWKYNFFCDYII